MIEITCENLEELFTIVGKTPLQTIMPDEETAKLKNEIKAMQEERDTILAHVKDLSEQVDRYRSLLEVATAKADKLEKQLLEAIQPAPTIGPEDMMPAPEPEPEPVKAEAKAPSLAEVRAVLKKLQDTKGTEAVKALVVPYGVKAISKVPEEHFAEIMAKAEEALNG